MTMEERDKLFDLLRKQERLQEEANRLTALLSILAPEALDEYEKKKVKEAAEAELLRERVDIGGGGKP